MTEVNECKGEMMGSEKVGILATKTDEQGSKLVNPSETAFSGETPLVICRRLHRLAVDESCAV